MSDLVAGLGIALVLEGLLWALAPSAAKKMVAEMATLPTRHLQAVAWGIVALGCVLVGVTRG
ncbi:MAG: DUF2065 domain-containing protein [Hyphomicrobium sp.]|nr:DUF2065 domain-containing protein [Hyphomicrobium sp.]